MQKWQLQLWCTLLCVAAQSFTTLATVDWEPNL